MADKVKVTLLRPLNGQQVGATAEYDKKDADRLARLGAVKISKSAEKPETKREAEPANKREAAPANKSK